MEKIIHHIAPKDPSLWHPIWKRCRDSFVKNFPDYEHKLWNDHEDIDRLVYDQYKEFWNLYSSFPHHIMKIDFSRLCILHQCGGIYADMDYYCYDNFEKYLTKENVFIENTSDLYTNAEYENCLMASQSNSKFLYNVTKHIKSAFILHRHMFNADTKDWRSYNANYAVNNTTGSGMISACIKSFGRYFSVGNFPAKLFNEDPIVYSKQLIGKHLHSSLWGNDYIKHSSREGFIIKEGNIWNCSLDHLETKLAAQKWEDFDFYKNYNDTQDNTPDSSNQ